MPWLEFALLGLLLVIGSLQPHMVLQTAQTAASPIQRRYITGANHPLLAGLTGLYQLSTISLALLVAVAALLGRGREINPQQYLLTVGIVAGISVVKFIVEQWIYITFRYTLNRKTYASYRSSLWTILSVVLWVLLVFSNHLDASVLWLVPSILVGIYWGILWWRIMQAFGWEASHIGYSLLYMLHIEILPVALAAMGVAYILE